MLKKIFLLFILFFGIGFGNVYGSTPNTMNTEQEAKENLSKQSTEEIKTANDAVITEQNSKLVKNTSELKGEELKQALANNSAAAQIMSTYAEKNLTLAKENYKNSESYKSIEKQITKEKQILETGTEKEKKLAEEKIAAYESAIKLGKEKDPDIVAAEGKVEQAKKLAEETREDLCTESKGCIDKPSFTIKVNDISPGMNVNSENTKNNVNTALGIIIQKLMIALGSISLLIMTIGAGYMVLYHGQDELLSKGKSIFMSGIYALVVALSAYYLVAIVRYLLFQ